MRSISLTRKPDVKTVAIINPDYAFGQDAAKIFKAALQALKPDIEIVAELFPKLGSPNYQTEISRLATARPDVIFSNLWGADLENFVRQASPRGLFTSSQVVLALGETVLQRVPSAGRRDRRRAGRWLVDVARCQGECRDGEIC